MLVSLDHIILQTTQGAVPDLNTVVTVLGIVLPVLGGIYALARKLDMIERNTEPIKEIDRSLVRIDERTKNLPVTPPATKELMLSGVGRVLVSAEPSERQTVYTLRFDQPILFQGIFQKFSMAPDSTILKKEKEIFGVPVQGNILTQNQMLVYVPSTDTEVCKSYISYFLKWIDTVYFPNFARVRDEYENISVA